MVILIRLLSFLSAPARNTCLHELNLASSLPEIENYWWRSRVPRGRAHCRLQSHLHQWKMSANVIHIWTFGRMFSSSPQSRRRGCKPWPPSSAHGGSEMFARQVQKGLSPVGHQTKVIETVCHRSESQLKADRRTSFLLSLAVKADEDREKSNGRGKLEKPSFCGLVQVCLQSLCMSSVCTVFKFHLIHLRHCDRRLLRFWLIVVMITGCQETAAFTNSSLTLPHPFHVPRTFSLNESCDYII